jgi:hypothetical protein
MSRCRFALGGPTVGAGPALEDETRMRWQPAVLVAMVATIAALVIPAARPSIGVEFAVATDGLGSRQSLDVDASSPKFVDRTTPPWKRLIGAP